MKFFSSKIPPSPSAPIHIIAFIHLHFYDKGTKTTPGISRVVVIFQLVVQVCIILSINTSNMYHYFYISVNAKMFTNQFSYRRLE